MVVAGTWEAAAGAVREDLLEVEPLEEDPFDPEEDLTFAGACSADVATAVAAAAVVAAAAAAAVAAAAAAAGISVSATVELRFVAEAALVVVA